MQCFKVRIQEMVKTNTQAKDAGKEKQMKLKKIWNLCPSNISYRKSKIVYS
jgi:hypothetical protein